MHILISHHQQNTVIEKLIVLYAYIYCGVSY